MSVIEYSKLEHLLPVLFEEGRAPFFILLDGVTDVRNLGAIIRTAEAAGIHALILPEKRSALPNFDTVKTSAGALFHLPICRTRNIKDTLNYLKESGLQLIAATEEGDKSYYEIDFTLPTVIILGSEDKGLSKPVYETVSSLVKIPMRGKTSSLNVSVAAALLMYESVRQRMTFPQS
jgi:23S rRNA (guanosine2251-2'-O)-methyltransferase